MKLSYKFSALCGLAYTKGNILFSDMAAADSRAILSPVGNRVSNFDLTSNKLSTFEYQTRNNIRVMALSPNGLFLILIDEEGRGLLVNYHRQVVLSHFNLKARVKRVVFSPDSRQAAWNHASEFLHRARPSLSAVALMLSLYLPSCFAVGYVKMVEIWQVPKVADTKEFAPLVLKVKIRAHFDQISGLEWSGNSRYLLTASKDMTAKVLAIDGPEDYVPVTLSAHKDGLLGAFFSSGIRTIYTVSREGALFEWQWEASQEHDALDEHPIHPGKGRFLLVKKNYFNQAGKLTSVAFHEPTGLLAVGLSTGVFQICQLPDFTILQSLSVFQSKVNTIALCRSGDWLAMGSIASGQLVVWEWQSETFVLRQQGRYEDVQCVAYASEGQLMATGARDGRVRLWQAESAFSFVTFADHTAPVHSVEFTKRGRVLLSAAADGTVRAYDLIRYRNFRVLSSPKPVVFSCLAADPSGEIVLAGSWDTFEIYVWSLQTGHLLELLAGHQGPICSLAFDPMGRYCASSSIDKSLRLWTLYASETQGEPGIGLSRSVHAQSFDVGSELLAVAFRPDGKEIAAASLNGLVGFWNPETGAQVGSIDGGRDIAGGRQAGDRRTSASSMRSRHFTTLCYSADSSLLLAGGLSKFICIYDMSSVSRPLLKKFVTTRNLSIDGLQEKLNSKLLTEAGRIDMIADSADEASGALYRHASAHMDDSDSDDRELAPDSQKQHWALSLAAKLPGVSSRQARASIRTRSVRFSPDGRSWIAATTEGLLLYTLDETLVFDPVELTPELTPELVRTTMAAEPSRALRMALALNEPALVHELLLQVSLPQISSVVGELLSLPSSSPSLLLKRIERLLSSLAGMFEKSVPFIEHHLAWIRAILLAHGELIKRKLASSTARGIALQGSGPVFSVTRLLGSLRSLQRSVLRSYEPLSKLSNENRHLLLLLTNAARQ